MSLCLCAYVCFFSDSISGGNSKDDCNNNTTRGAHTQGGAGATENVARSNNKKAKYHKRVLVEMPGR